MHTRPFYSCGSVTRPMNGSEANAGLLVSQYDLHDTKSEVRINTRSPAASLPFIGRFTEEITVKWPIMAPERPAAIDRILVAQILSHLKSFTKVPKSGTLSQYQLLLHLVFVFTFTKNVGAFFCKIMNWPSRTYAAPYFLYINDSRGGLSHKPGGFLRSPRYYLGL